LYKACWLKDNGISHLPKKQQCQNLYCAEIANEVAYEAVQMHGGYGLMKDYDVERFTVTSVCYKSEKVPQKFSDW
jgi:short-chain 2-methylacyl-CoA dehydrogenase